MASTWQTSFSSASRRKQTILITLSALVPFGFCFIWLLSLSHPTILPEKIQEHHAAQNIETYSVEAPTGTYIGKVNDRYHNVHEFLNVPYGLSTTGSNRFKPPVPVPFSNETFDATELAKACPQFISSARTVWTEQIPWYRIPHDGSNHDDLMTEDCLSLAIWAPIDATDVSKYPVAVFWPGESQICKLS